MITFMRIFILKTATVFLRLATVQCSPSKIEKMIIIFCLAVSAYARKFFTLQPQTPYEFIQGFCQNTNNKTELTLISYKKICLNFISFIKNG